MFALPTWLAIYLSIGAAIVFIGSYGARRDNLPRDLSWAGCAAVVLIIMTAWPLWAVLMVRRRVRRGVTPD